MFLSFGAVKKNWILFIIVPSLYFFRQILESKAKDETKNLFFNVFIRFFTRSLNIFLWILLKKKMALSKKKEDLINNNDQSFLSNLDESMKNSEEENSKRTFSQFEIEKERDRKKKEEFIKLKKKSKLNSKIILLIAIFFDFISCSISLVSLELDILQNVSVGLIVLSICIRLIFFALFSYIFIKSSKNYIHHYVSAIVIGIIAIVCIISSLIIDKNGNKDFFVKFVLKVIPDILYSFAYIFGLKYLIRTSGNIYKFLSLCGIVEMAISIIIQFIMSFINCKNYNYFKQNFIYCNNDNGKYKTILFNLKNYKNFGGINTIILIIVNFIEKLCEYLLIYNFSLNHFGAIYAIPTYFKNIFLELSLINTIFYIIGGIIIILMTFVYNEIIILRFCGLDKNTKIEIMKRSYDDTEINNFNEENPKPVEEDDD